MWADVRLGLFSALASPLVLLACGDGGGAGADAGPVWECPGPRLRGVDVGGADTRAELDELGARAVHFWIHWDDVQPVLTAPLVTSSEITDAMVQDFADGEAPGVSWSVVDADFDRWDGLTIIPGIGSGYTVDMPSLDGARITPDSIGREAYLGQLSLYARALVRRYAGRAPMYHVENEVNVANFALLAGIRTGQAWTDAAFVDQVVATLSAAVRAEDPAALVTTNLHTDIIWEDDVARFAPQVDWIGLDAYPNYGAATPLKAELAAARVARARALSGGMPVVILETGYPSGPADEDYSEALQADYFRQVYPGSEAAGACGVFYFKLRTDEEAGTEVTPQENYWGMFRADGSKKPVWDVMHELFTAPEAPAGP